MPRSRGSPRQSRDITKMLDRELPGRKVFNCIVDETALVDGTKRSTRDGIVKWISSGAILLFVPLYTLERLDRMKRGRGRLAADALTWLDGVTSEDPGAQAANVRLQGVSETYGNWAEVEKHLLPDTLLSMDVEENGVEELASNMDEKLNLGDRSDLLSISSTCSAETPSKAPSSPASACSSLIPEGSQNTSPDQHDSSQDVQHLPPQSSEKAPSVSDKVQSAVPNLLRPFFNHLLWRIHQDPSCDFGVDGFILLSNDPQKQAIAQRFGIRVKRLEQLREAIVREDRDYENRLQLHAKERQPATSVRDIEADDEVVLKRPVRNPPTKPAAARIWDPDEFGRAPFRPRGRGRAGARGAAQPPRMPRNDRRDRSGPDRPIDPNSFSRPPPRFYRARGGRRLWEPT